MPPKKQEEPKSCTEACILKNGRYNNVVQWREEMQDHACTLYGMTGMFFTTNASHFIPYPCEEGCNPATPAAGQGADEAGAPERIIWVDFHSGLEFKKMVEYPCCDSTGSRVPILPGTDSTGSYRVLLLYTTVRL